MSCMKQELGGKFELEFPMSELGRNYPISHFHFRKISGQGHFNEKYCHFKRTNNTAEISNTFKIDNTGS